MIPTRTQDRKGATGAASELRACAYLIDQGYYVYRCESPHAPFDLVAYRDGKCLRVEVKSITYFADRPTYAPAVTWPRNEEWDLLICVFSDRIFEFAQGVTREEVRDHIRVAFGFSLLVELKPCGTFAAYQRHFDREEVPCEPCTTAARQARRKYYRRSVTVGEGAP